jgi:hypothetical protein
MKEQAVTPAKKRTRVQPPYMAMYHETKTKLDRVMVELEHIRSRMDLEIAYSGKLGALLKKEGGQS